MRHRIQRPSPSLVISLLALFVAMGGTSYAAITITGKNVKNSSLSGADVKNSSLSGADVKNNSLSGSDVLESKLGKVPLAGRADTATSAGTAVSAASAATAGTAGTAGRASSAASADLARAVSGNGVSSSAIQDGAITGSKLGGGTTVYSGPGVNVANNTTGVATATCPNGGRIQGGGASWVAPNLGLATVDSYPTGSSSWSVTGANTSGGQKTLRARVLCLD